MAKLSFDVRITKCLALPRAVTSTSMAIKMSVDPAKHLSIFRGPMIWEYLGRNDGDGW